MRRAFRGWWLKRTALWKNYPSHMDSFLFDQFPDGVAAPVGVRALIPMGAKLGDFIFTDPTTVLLRGIKRVLHEQGHYAIFVTDIQNYDLNLTRNGTFIIPYEWIADDLPNERSLNDALMRSSDFAQHQDAWTLFVGAAGKGRQEKDLGFLAGLSRYFGTETVRQAQARLSQLSSLNLGADAKLRAICEFASPFRPASDYQAVAILGTDYMTGPLGPAIDDKQQHWHCVPSALIAAAGHVIWDTFEEFVTKMDFGCTGPKPDRLHQFALGHGYKLPRHFTFDFGRMLRTDMIDGVYYDVWTSHGYTGYQFGTIDRMLMA